LQGTRAYLVFFIIISAGFITLSQVSSPGLWRNRLEDLTADQKVWGLIPTLAKAK
jgi:hypothetical protein